MPGCISNPKKHPAMAHAKPAINIAAHLNDRTIKRRNLPPGQRWWCGWNQRALRSSRRVKVLFQISAPRFQFFVLLEQLLAHRTQTQLRFDACAEHLGMNWLGHEIIRASFQTKHLTFLSAMTGKHDSRNLRYRRREIGPTLCSNISTYG